MIIKFTFSCIGGNHSMPSSHRLLATVLAFISYIVPGLTNWASSLHYFIARYGNNSLFVVDDVPQQHRMFPSTLPCRYWNFKLNQTEKLVLFSRDTKSRLGTIATTTITATVNVALCEIDVCDYAHITASSIHLLPSHSRAPIILLSKGVGLTTRSSILTRNWLLWWDLVLTGQ